MVKKRIIKYLSLIFLLLIYLLISKKFHLYIPCYIHEITGLYCPGCGITRMLISILNLDFYKAFRYNPFLFILSPFVIFLYIENIYAIIKNKTPLYKKIDNRIWIILIIALLIYGIVRNIYLPLAPTKI